MRAIAVLSSLPSDARREPDDGIPSVMKVADWDGPVSSSSSSSSSSPPSSSSASPVKEEWTYLDLWKYYSDLSIGP